MSDVGDTKVGRATITPSMGEGEVSVGLTHVIYEGKMWQFFGGADPWMPFPNRYWSGAWLDITNIESIEFSIDPLQATGEATFDIDPYGSGNENIFRITIPVTGNFIGSTGYTWSVTASITHGTYDEGEVTRSYGSTDQIVDVFGTVSDPMSFTTEPSVPLKATNPNPADTDTEVDFSDYTISWDDGGGADSYNVYFGDATTPVSLGNQAETSIEIPYTTEVDEEGVTHAYVNGTEIDWNTTFYWRIDAVNASGTTPGDVWTFSAIPAKVTNPTPGDTDTGISIYPEYSWDASTVAASYDLYVAVGDYNIGVEGLEEVSYDSAVVDFQNGYIWGYDSDYLWRIDAVNEFGIGVGDEWTFHSIALLPPLPPWHLIDGGSGYGPPGSGARDGGGDVGEDEGWGEEGVDWAWDAGAPLTAEKLVVAAANKIFYEDE